MKREDVMAALLEAIEASEDGVCVADAAGTVRYQNAAFRALMRGGEAQVLGSAVAEAQAALRARSDRPRREDSASGPSTVVLEGRPAGFRIRCVATSAAAAGLGGGVVTWISRLGAHRVPVTELQRRYGLTPREARVAMLLASGAHAREIAQALGISPHTARRHAESVMRKLGVHSRMEVRDRTRTGE